MSYNELHVYILFVAQGSSMLKKWTTILSSSFHFKDKWLVF